MLTSVAKKNSVPIVAILTFGTANIPSIANTDDVSRAVAVGANQQKNYHWGAVHPDCTSAGLPTVRVKVLRRKQTRQVHDFSEIEFLQFNGH